MGRILCGRVSWAERRAEIEGRLDDAGKRNLDAILGRVRSDICIYGVVRHRDTLELSRLGFDENQILEYLETLAFVRKI